MMNWTENDSFFLTYIIIWSATSFILFSLELQHSYKNVRISGHVLLASSSTMKIEEYDHNIRQWEELVRRNCWALCSKPILTMTIPIGQVNISSSNMFHLTTHIFPEKNVITKKVFELKIHLYAASTSLTSSLSIKFKKL